MKNMKQEARNQKQTRNLETRNVSDFGFLVSDLFRFSGFEFRIWNERGMK